MSEDPKSDSFFGIERGGVLTEEMFEYAVKKMLEIQPLCGSEKNPHLCRPVGAGVPTYCIQCGANVTY